MKLNFEFKAENVDANARTIEGYAATWDRDNHDDIIKRGAFTKTIQERLPKGMIKMLWQHNNPIGLPLEMREDERGLWVKARVSDTTLGNDALVLMRDGVINQMSIGFSVIKSNVGTDGVRVITEAKLYEFSPVTFPANDNAEILAVKQLHAALKDGSIDRAELKKLIKSLLDDEPPEGTHEEEQPILGDEQKALAEMLQAFELKLLLTNRGLTA